MPRKKESKIKLSPKYGLNPTIPLCYFCLQPKNEVLLLGKSKGRGDLEAPHNVVFNHEPCDTCKGYMEKGVILVSVDEKKSKGDTENPYRTGGWVVVKDEALKRVIKSQELLDDILKQRIAFVPDDVWDRIGLPRGEVGAQ